MEIMREIEMDASPEDVWSALTDETQLEEWFANEVELEAVPGGRAVFRWGDGEVRHGVVETVEEEARLVLRWEDDGIVELELGEHAEGTRIHVRETAPEWGVALELHASAAWATA